MFVTARTVLNFVACGIIVSELCRSHCNVWAVVSICGFQKSNHAYFLRITKLYLSTKFHCRGAVVSEIREFKPEEGEDDEEFCILYHPVPIVENI